MTSDAKVGLLLGLLFIVVIAFLLNGPIFFRNSEKSKVETAVPAPSGRSIVIDQAVADVARDLQPPELRPSRPPQEVRILEDFSTEPVALTAQTRPEPPGVSPVPQTDSIHSSAPSPVTHIVRAGENLAVIAIRYYGKEMGNKRDTVKKLFEKNSTVLDSPDTIRVGDQLTIPALEDLFTPVPLQERHVEVERGFLERLQDRSATIASFSCRFKALLPPFPLPAHL